MRNSLFLLFILLITVCIFGLTSTTYAQANQQLQTVVNVDMIPQDPGANQVVKVTLTSYSTNINAANITWKINGKIQKTGKGEKTFSFTTGTINTTTSLDIIIVTVEGDIVTKTIKIKPTEIDLVWQAESFTPPFYKGKAMFTHQDKITFIAMPHMTNSSGAEISPKNLIYKWTRNGSVDENASGYGKNEYTFISPLISRVLNIDVEVTSVSTGSVGLAHTRISPIEPSIILYKKNPLYGIEFQKALADNIELKDSKEIVIVGMPFFFGTLDASNQDLSYKWSINGAPINNDPSQSEEVFRQKEGTSGTSNISLSIENVSKILEVATSNFNLKFGENSSQ